MSKISRRTFLGGALAAGALLGQGCASASKVFSIVPRHVLGGRGFVPPSEKLAIACVGVGGKGTSDIDGVSSQAIVALCDVDDRQTLKIYPKYPRAQKFRDWRVMLDKVKGIDAVVVSTPDHNHAVIALSAMQLGKHVFCQKPLAHTIEETRRMVAAAKQYNVVTQMGIQGHQGEGARRICEWIWSGTIGTVREIRYWTNRPIWPQGINRPKETPPVPPELDWDVWLGPAPERPYNPAYLPFVWRGWWDFGCGALGDIACHDMDAAFWALDLGSPESIEPNVSEGQTSECGPVGSVLTYHFAARANRPALKATWYDGKQKDKMPLPPELDPGAKIHEDGGQFIIGDKGVIMAAMYGNSPELIPHARMREFRDNMPPKMLPRSPGSCEEWIAACKGVAQSNMASFDYAGPLTEMVLLGNIALRTSQKIDFDGHKITNLPAANEYMQWHPRKGWGA